MQHQPVLLNEVLDSALTCPREIKYILDGTFGRGGHTRAFLDRFPEARVVALDRDIQAIEYGKVNFLEEIKNGRLTLIQSNFADAADLNIQDFDFALLDLGVSSPQLDVPERGFSFYKSGPLDMRMDQREPVSAHEIINFADEEDLIELFKKYGEVRSPQRVVRAICKDRQTKHFESTGELSKLIERVEGWRKKGQHPATLYFLALRIKVNHEFEDIERAVQSLPKLLNPDGRLAVISFHSAEDRIVKYAFRALAETDGILVNKKVIVPNREEEKSNPRSRSAKLRVYQRGDGQNGDGQKSRTGKKMMIKKEKTK